MKPIPIILLLLAPFAKLTAENISIEAESYIKQTLSETRKWEIKSELPVASGGKYIQVLPDTRWLKSLRSRDGSCSQQCPDHPCRVRDSIHAMPWFLEYGVGTESLEQA